MERLGEDESGGVYKAWDLRLERMVALKLLAVQRTMSAESRRRSLKAARLASSLDHPNVCTLFEIGQTRKGEIFLAMALCPGETLKARLQRGPLPLAQALDIAVQTIAGLTAAHQNGIVHQGVRPGNIVVSPEGRVKVVGFGVAQIEESGPFPGGEGASPEATSYMSPEQLRGGPLDSRSDIWSLGAVLFEMLTGKSLFQGISAKETVQVLLGDAPLPLAEPLAGVPPALRQIIERALARSPGRRYERIEEMGADLLAFGTAGLPESGALLDRETLTHVQPAAGPAALSGRTISHFQIGERLGGGGMGVVYQAEDTRLGRSVALKFLAPELVRNPAAKVRFLTEARAASALDHANLCAILEAGESEDGLLFLAMPRYDGESLERRIARGPLPVEEALEIATQAACGLAKAHAHGIVHRDVKPGNLFVTRDGVVKVLDFGIAKLTKEVGLTRTGFLLGTPFYMAPEQTRGQAVDARADVWSLGVVLYEMLAGRPPFAGETATAVAVAVLHEEPEPLARFRPEVPAELDRIILSRMLAKDPGRRYADAAEALAGLRSAASLPATVDLSPPPAPAARRPWRRLAWAVLGTAAAAAAIAAGVLTWRGGGAAQPLLPGRIAQLTDLQGSESFPSISPDGTFFVYAKDNGGHYDLFLQRVAGGRPINLTAGSATDNYHPAFSPDGQQIAFRSEREGGGVFLMGATGESVRRLTDFGYNPAWSPDGREIAVATEGAFTPTARFTLSQIVRIGVATGAQRPLGVQDGVQPAWSPHALRIAFWGVAEPGARRVIWTIPAGGGAPVPVVDDAFYNWSPVWAPDGRSLYFASNRGGGMNLWRVAIDEGSGRVSGVPQPVTTSSEWSALPSLSRDGTRLVYATDDSRSYVELVPVDPATGRAGGPPSLAYQGARAILSCDVSPDGAWLALWASFPAEDVLLIRSDGSEVRQLTNDLARDRTPYWSPDGRRILFASNRSGKYEAWTIRPDGSGLTRVTNVPDQPVLYPFWSPDGRRIGFNYFSRGTALHDLLRPGSRPRVLPPVPGGDGDSFAGTSWSGDGRLLAGVLERNASSRPGITLWSLADNTSRRLTGTGTNPVFFHGGTHVLFMENGMVRLVDVPRGEVRTVLSPPPHSVYVAARVGPEDKSLCAVRATDEGDIWSLSLAAPE